MIPLGTLCQLSAVICKETAKGMTPPHVDIQCPYSHPLFGQRQEIVDHPTTCDRGPLNSPLQQPPGPERPASHEMALVAYIRRTR